MSAVAGESSVTGFNDGGTSGYARRIVPRGEGRSTRGRPAGSFGQAPATRTRASAAALLPRHPERRGIEPGQGVDGEALDVRLYGEMRPEPYQRHQGEDVQGPGLRPPVRVEAGGGRSPPPPGKKPWGLRGAGGGWSRGGAGPGGEPAGRTAASGEATAATSR